MEKVKIENNAFVYPMPMVLVGAMVEYRANFMAVGWVARVNFNPLMIAVALGNALGKLPDAIHVAGDQMSAQAIAQPLSKTQPIPMPSARATAISDGTSL